MRIHLIIFLLNITILFIPGIAQPHIGGNNSGFYTGLFHPVFGYDHLLAMVCVGILSAQIGGRAVWMVPITFVGIMIVGGILGVLDIFIPFVEFGIMLSVFSLGLAIAVDKKLGILASYAIVAFFAVFHGHAHGVEMPLLADPVIYVLGFLTSTSILHLTGVLIGFAANYTTIGSLLLTFSGAIISLFGLFLLVKNI